MATSVNEHTGKIIKSGTDNYNAYSKNYDLIGSNTEYADKTETLFPVTIKIPKSLYKDLALASEIKGITVAEALQRIVLETLE